MRTWTTALAAALLGTAPATGQERTEVRTYTIHHTIFGDIGTLSDEITQDGASARVVTRAEVRVAVLGLTLHHIRAEWSETWHEDTLRVYRATTTRNGNTISISGEQENGRFVVRTHQREFTAPADIHPVHPWSLRFVRAATLISPESGHIFPASIEDKGNESISIRGASRHVRHFVASLDTANHLYFDGDGVLVLAEYRDITGSVRFTLQSPGERAVASAR